jgi:hypothetical protein
MQGVQDSLLVFQCNCLIFALPNAGNFRQFASMRGMARFVCPNWTEKFEKELLALIIAFGGKLATDEVSRRFDLLGGSPRSVIAEDLDIALIQETDVPDIALILVVPYFCLKNYRSTHHTFFQYNIIFYTFCQPSMKSSFY